MERERKESISQHLKPLHNHLDLDINKVFSN
jgi:hypothetical protein